MASNDLKTVKGAAGGGCLTLCYYSSSNCLEGWKKTEDETQESRYNGWDSNRVPPEYKSEALPLKPPCSVPRKTIQWDGSKSLLTCFEWNLRQSRPYALVACIKYVILACTATRIRFSMQCSRPLDQPLLFLAYFPYFAKIKSAYENTMLFVYLWMPEPIYIKLGMYIMATEPISTACFINASKQSIRLPPVDARQCLDKHVHEATYTRSDIWTAGCVIFYEICVLSKESLWVCVSSYRCQVTTG
jgi:hypothetical protein